MSKLSRHILKQLDSAKLFLKLIIPLKHIFTYKDKKMRVIA